MSERTLAEEKTISQLMPQRFGRRGIIWISFLTACCVFGLVAYATQLDKGLVVTNLGDYVS